VSAGIKHSVGVKALTGLLLVGLFLPFLPGKYDDLAVTVSGLAQVLGFAGFLLVPLGTGWLIHEALRRRARESPRSGTDKSYWFELAALCCAALIAAILCLGMFVSGRLTLAFTSLALSTYVLARLARRLGGPKYAPDRPFHPARNRAIRNSAPLIAEIEAFRAARGHYPLSLAALHKDHDPGVMGVRQYEYEPRGDAYSVYFEQFAIPIGVREIVMYNKLDEHALPAHDTDILRWTPEQLRARPGHNVVHDAPSPHWKYFWFD
jgi:hypothetical protein